MFEGFQKFLKKWRENKQNNGITPFVVPNVVVHDYVRQLDGQYFHQKTSTSASSVRWLLLITIITSLAFSIFASVFIHSVPKSQAVLSPAWYDNGWLHRRALVVDHTKVPSDQTNFPVLISLSSLSGINTNGTDIRFTTSDGTTLLPREIESYSSGTLVAWVKTNLSSTVDTTIYMYYGNSGATEPAANSTYGRNNVWTNGYAGVYHLATGAGSSLVTTDSTGNNDGTNNSTTTTSGQIDGAGSFDGSSKYVYLSNTSALSFDSNSSFSIGAWIKYSSSPQQENIIAKQQSSSSWPGYGFEIASAGANPDLFLYNGTRLAVGFPSTYADGNWHFIVGTYTGNLLASGVVLYVDGAPVSGTVLSNNLSGSITNSSSFQISGRGASTSNLFTGAIDNVGVSTSVRTATWISTEYANQSSPSTFINSTAAEQTITVPDAPTIGTATAGNAQASVTFSAPANDGGQAITGYTVTSSPGSLTGTGASSPITVTGLTNGTSYTFTAHATNALGNSAESAASNAVTPATTPGVPTAVVATAGAEEMSVAFSAPVDDGGATITQYTVTSTPGSFTGTGPSSPITVPSLSTNIAYTFTVHATNSVGNSAESTASSARYALANTPTVSVAGGWDSSSHYKLDATINANGNPDGTDYWLQYSTNGTSFSDPADMTWQTGVSYTLANLSGNTMYWLKVRARNGDAVSTGYSAPTADITPPTAPTSLNSSSICQTTALVAWVASAGADKYTLSYGTDTTGTNLGIIGDLSDTQRLLVNLTDGTQYYYKVSATSNLNGTGDYSNTGTFTTTFCTAPTASSSVAGSTVNAVVPTSSASLTLPTVTTQSTSDVTSSGATGNGTITSTGGASIAIRGFDYATDSSTSHDCSALGDILTSSDEDGHWDIGTYTESFSGLSVNSYYCARAYAANSIGSGFGEWFSFDTLANVPGTPIVDMPTISSLRIVIDQNSNPSDTKYAIYNKTLSKYVQADGSSDASTVWQTYSFWGGASGIINTNLASDTNYTYKVMAVNSQDVATALSTGASERTAAVSTSKSNGKPIGPIATAATVTISISVYGIIHGLRRLRKPKTNLRGQI